MSSNFSTSFCSNLKRSGSILELRWASPPGIFTYFDLRRIHPRWYSTRVSHAVESTIELQLFNSTLQFLDFNCFSILFPITKTCTAFHANLLEVKVEPPLPAKQSDIDIRKYTTCFKQVGHCETFQFPIDSSSRRSSALSPTLG